MKKLEKLEKTKSSLQLADMSKTPKMRVSFKFFEDKYQIVELSKLKSKDCKRLVKFIDKLHKNDNYIESINRGKIGKNNKLSNHELIEEIIHLKVDNKFRIHGVLRGIVFYIISIDPNHKLHNK